MGLYIYILSMKDHENTGYRGDQCFKRSSFQAKVIYQPCYVWRLRIRTQISHDLQPDQPLRLFLDLFKILASSQDPRPDLFILFYIFVLKYLRSILPEKQQIILERITLTLNLHCLRFRLLFFQDGLLFILYLPFLVLLAFCFLFLPFFLLSWLLLRLFCGCVITFDL